MAFLKPAASKAVCQSSIPCLKNGRPPENPEGPQPTPEQMAAALDSLKGADGWITILDVHWLREGHEIEEVVEYCSIVEGVAEKNGMEFLGVFDVNDVVKGAYRPEAYFLFRFKEGRRVPDLQRDPEYAKLIHNEYVFRVDPAEIDIVGSAELSAVEDLESTEAMFAGESGLEPVVDPVTGQPTGEFRVVAPVQSIELDLTPDSASSWTQMEDGEFQGSWRRVYDVDMTVRYSDGDVQTIRGKQVFYVLPGTLRDDTSGDEYWQLRAWEDQGIDS